ncbi:hypothetical protein [Acinetobacter sp. S40]|uniref:hypothetical protein n=1 Tax=Acinetobacter sp. S40 TaxID=2767434 RepID=UPI001D0E5AEF|nr:hypothetical protein [Acinetobacter sp. S40]
MKTNTTQSNVDSDVVLTKELLNAADQVGLTVTGTTSFDGTKDLNVTAGIEHNSQSSHSKTNSQSMSYTYGGDGSA